MCIDAISDTLCLDCLCVGYYSEDSTAWEVDIAPGTYVEQISITRAGPITFRGQTNGTPLSYLDNLVTIAWNQTTASVKEML
jgi:hypothetical protein